MDNLRLGPMFDFPPPHSILPMCIACQGQHVGSVVGVHGLVVLGPSFKSHPGHYLHVLHVFMWFSFQTSKTCWKVELQAFDRFVNEFSPIMS